MLDDFKKNQNSRLNIESNTLTQFDMSFWKDRICHTTKIMTIINDNPVFF